MSFESSGFPKPTNQHNLISDEEWSDGDVNDRVKCRYWLQLLKKPSTNMTQKLVSNLTHPAVTSSATVANCVSVRETRWWSCCVFCVLYCSVFCVLYCSVFCIVLCSVFCIVLCSVFCIVLCSVLFCDIVLLCVTISLVVLWSEFLATDHEVPGSIPGPFMDHGLGSSVELRFKAPPCTGTTPYERPNLRSRLHFGHNREGKPRSP
jgi:hypothetical protein